MKNTKIFLILALILIGFLGVKSYQKFKETQKLERKLNFLKTKLGEIEKENKALKNQIDYFKEPQNLEKEVRKRLPLKKKGEKVLVITP